MTYDGSTPLDSQKQENFANKYVECGNQSEAYRQSYDVNPDCKPETIWCNSCQLMSDTKVSQRVFFLQQAAQERTLVTVESLTKELDESRNLAKETKQPAAMNQATMGKAKLHGLDVNKTEVSGPNGSVVFEFIPVGNKSE